MSAAGGALSRKQRPGVDRRPAEQAPRREWIGVDLAGMGERGPSPAVLPLLMLALVVALAVAALRIDLIRTRYALAEAMAEEQALIEEQRSLIVRKRQLRDPAVLTGLARERGFRPIEAQRILVDPRPPVRPGWRGPARSEPPAVAAAPPLHVAEAGDR